MRCKASYAANSADHGIYVAISIQKLQKLRVCFFGMM
jgi:hypothetical protein